MYCRATLCFMSLCIDILFSLIQCLSSASNLYHLSVFCLCCGIWCFPSVDTPTHMLHVEISISPFLKMFVFSAPMWRNIATVKNAIKLRSFCLGVAGIILVMRLCSYMYNEDLSPFLSSVLANDVLPFGFARQCLSQQEIFVCRTTVKKKKKNYNKIYVF